MEQIKRTAIVTAAAQGMGGASARRLAAMGMNLSLVDIQEDALEKQAEHCRNLGVQVITTKADVTDTVAIADVVAKTKASFGRIDALLNIAGGAGPRNLHQIDEIEPEDWDLVMSLNLRSTYLWCKAVMPIMREQEYGRIVNMSSTIARGKHGPVGTAGARLAYAAAKAGILGFTAQLAKDVGQYGITVNAVMPWLTLSDVNSRVRQRFQALEPAAREKLLSASPMRRPAEADEIAAAIAFLASEQASYVSGIGMPVDGSFL
jgi:NAD(P)-dependent dehydrogenase (short-subunit alcohol dehydrogenase family)